jgi:hypothetical protein
MNMTIAEVASLRAQLWDTGLRPVPVYTVEAGKRLGHDKPGNHPWGDGWQNRARLNPPEAVTAAPQLDTLNTGILCDGLRIIDFDIDNLTLAKSCLDVCFEMFGEAPTRWRANSPRRAVVYRAAEGEPSKVVVAGRLGKIEVLGRGQQLVAFGDYESGVELQWVGEAPGEIARDEIRAVTEEQINAFLTRCAVILDAKPPSATNGNGQDHKAGEPQADALRIAAALYAIPNNGPANWEWWNKIAMAIWAATAGSPAGWVLLNAWSARNDTYDPAQTCKRWDHFKTSPPTKIGAGSIFHMAKEAQRAQRAREAAANNGRRALRCYTLSGLHGKDIIPMKWILPNYIPEGLTVLAGKPKIGKSWLILAIGLAVARKTEVLGQCVENGGDVLYGAFEDGERRMKARVEQILGPNQAWPDNFHVIHQLDPLDAGGLDDIERWLIDHPNARLVVLDTFGRIRGSRPTKEDPYQHDTRIVGALQTLANNYAIAVVLVHHVRKGDAEDILDTISGTTGIAGAADTPAVLSQTKDGGRRLYLRGRDAEEQDKLVDFDPDTGTWTVIGDHYANEEQAAVVAGLRRKILDLLTASPVPMTPADIAIRLAAKPNTVRQACRRMATDGQISPSLNQFGAYTAGVIKKAS